MPLEYGCESGRDMEVPHDWVLITDLTSWEFMMMTGRWQREAEIDQRRAHGREGREAIFRSSVSSSVSDFPVGLGECGKGICVALSHR